MSEPGPEFLTDLAELLTKLARHDASSEAYLLETLLPSAPAALLVGLVTLACNLSDESYRMLALLLVKRLVLKPVDQSDPTAFEQHGKQIWDLLSNAERDIVQNKLLFKLQHAEQLREPERNVLCGTIGAIETACCQRGYIWADLRQTLGALHDAQMLASREIAFKTYSECPSILADASPADIVKTFKSGLNDESPGVRLAALSAVVNILLDSDAALTRSLVPLAVPMLDVLPFFASSRSEERLAKALMELSSLTTAPKAANTMLKSHLAKVSSFLADLIKPSNLAVSPNHSQSPFDSSVRRSAVEFQVSLLEALKSSRKAISEVASTFVPVLLAVMIEVEEDPDWAASEDINDLNDEAMYVIGEEALDRIAHICPAPVYTTFSAHAIEMLRNDHWQVRHAALSALAVIAGPCHELVIEHVEQTVSAAVGMAADSHPRVRQAAIYALSQLCSDLEGAAQEYCLPDIVQALVNVMKDSSIPRLQAFAAAACINMLDTSDIGNRDDKEQLTNELFESLFALVNHAPMFVKINALQSIALLADCCEASLAPYYPRIMPLLLNVLEQPATNENSALQSKALDCAATLGACVPQETFAPDASRLLAVMHRMQGVAAEHDSNELVLTLLGAYAALAQTVGPARFAPYVDDIFGPLIEASSKKPEVVVGPSEDDLDQDERWETIEVNGSTVAVRSGDLEAKSEAVNNLLVLVQAIRENLGGDRLAKVFEVAIPLLTYYFNIEVREYAAALLDATVESMVLAGLPQDYLVKQASAAFDALSTTVSQDTDVEVSTTFVGSWVNILNHVPQALSPDAETAMLKAIEAQLARVLGGSGSSSNNPEPEWEDEEDEIEEAQDRFETESTLLTAINLAIRNVFGLRKASFNLQLFLHFLPYCGDADMNKRAFSQRLMADTIRVLGPWSFQYVHDQLTTVVHNCQDEGESLQTAAEVVACAAEFAPQQYADFLVAASTPLVNSIPQHPEWDVSDEEVMICDVVLGSVAQVVLSITDRGGFDRTNLVKQWASRLPARLSEDEMARCCMLILHAASANDRLSEIMFSEPKVFEQLTLALGEPNFAQRQPLATQVAQAVRSLAEQGGRVIPNSIHQRIIELLASA